MILRHVLSGHRPASALAAVEGLGAWSSPEAAAAAALLRDGAGPGADPARWLSTLPATAGASLLRKVWADDLLAETPWDDAWRVLRQERSLQRLLRLERDLRRWAEADDRETAAAELVELLLEYKILRSDLLGPQA